MKTITAQGHGGKIGDLIHVNGETLRIVSVLDSNTFTFREPRWYDRPILFLLTARALFKGWLERLNA